MRHELKCWPEYFQAIKAGDKRFELRKDDREPKYEVGHTLVLEEWTPCKMCGGFGLVTPDDANSEVCPRCKGDRGEYSGRAVEKRVDYVLRGSLFGGLQGGYVIMSI